MVQANELGMNAVGIDVSYFNSFISNCKVDDYNIPKVVQQSNLITLKLKRFLQQHFTLEFEEELLKELNVFNNKYFPSPEYKYKINQREINEDKYGREKEKLFLPIYKKLIDKYEVVLAREKSDTFLDKWFFQHVSDETEFVYSKIKRLKNTNIKDILKLF